MKVEIEMSTDISSNNQLIADYQRYLSQSFNGNKTETLLARENAASLYPHIKSLAESGDSRAQFCLGISHPKRSEQRHHHLLSASEKGNLDATFELMSDHLECGELHQAAKLAKSLLGANDLFLKDKTQRVIRNNHHFKQLMKGQSAYSTNKGMLFFKPQEPSDESQNQHEREHTQTYSN